MSVAFISQSGKTATFPEQRLTTDRFWIATFRGSQRSPDVVAVFTHFTPEQLGRMLYLLSLSDLNHAWGEMPRSGKDSAWEPLNRWTSLERKSS